MLILFQVCLMLCSIQYLTSNIESRVSVLLYMTSLLMYLNFWLPFGLGPHVCWNWLRDLCKTDDEFLLEEMIEVIVTKLINLVVGPYY